MKDGIAKHKVILQVLAIAAICAAIYIPSLGNGFIWDDDDYVYGNRWVKSMDGLQPIWLSHSTRQYYPLVYTSFWVEHKIWGLNPFGYHAVNMILHTANAILVFFLIRCLYPQAAFAAALLFAVHPIQVETVAWVSERKNLLSLLFFLSAILSYVRYEKSRKIAWYLLTGGLFLLALFSKSIAVCFAAIPILYAWWKEGKVGVRAIGSSIPFFLLGVLAAANTVYMEAYKAGAQGDSWSLTMAERFILSGRTALFYIFKICVPVNFVFFYPRWTIDAGQLWQWSFSIAVIGIPALLFYYRRQLGRGAFALFLFYLISIFPAAGFINVYPMRYSFVADHFSYLSTPSIFLFLCAGVIMAYHKIRAVREEAGDALRRTLPYVFAVAVVFLSVSSIILTRNYKDQVTLWNNVIRNNPGSTAAYNNLGNIYIKMGKPAEALALFRKAVEVDPGYAKTYNNLGALFKKIGNTEKAVSCYKKAIELNKDYFAPYNNLGAIYGEAGRVGEALDMFKKCIEKNPDSAEGNYNLSVAYFNNNQFDLSVKYFDRAIALGYDRYNREIADKLKEYRKNN